MTTAAIGVDIPSLGYSCYRIVATYDAATPAGIAWNRLASVL